MADGRQRRERSKRRDDRGRSRDRRRRRRDDEEEDANRAKLVPARAPSPPPPKHPPRGAAPKGKAREKNEETDDDSEGEESSGGEPDMEVETTVPGKKEAKLAADNDDKAAKANKPSASAVAEDPRLLPEPKGSDGAGDGKRGRSQPAGGAGGKPPPKAKKSDKLMIKDDSQTDEDRTSSYNCDVCGRYVGGGAAGRYQHLRSPFHLSCQLWQSGKYPRLFSKPWPTLTTRTVTATVQGPVAHFCYKCGRRLSRCSADACNGSSVKKGSSAVQSLLCSCCLVAFLLPPQSQVMIQ